MLAWRRRQALELLRHAVLDRAGFAVPQGGKVYRQGCDGSAWRRVWCALHRAHTSKLEVELEQGIDVTMLRGPGSSKAWRMNHLFRLFLENGNLLCRKANYLIFKLHLRQMYELKECNPQMFDMKTVV